MQEHTNNPWPSSLHGRLDAHRAPQETGQPSGLQIRWALARLAGAATRAC